MFSLCQPNGPHPVGAVTLTAPVRPSLTIGAATLRASGEPAFRLQEVAFTAYYPADVSKEQAKGLHWLIRPIRSSLSGFAHFTGLSAWLLWPVVYLFGAALKIPVHPNAPLLSPESHGPSNKLKPPLRQWPLVIFSHGLCGTRTAYSQLCSQMAASGNVVLAVEHRDGTAPACTTRTGSPNGKPGTRTILYYQDDDVVWAENNSSDPSAFPIRVDQLVFRQHELYLIYSAFCQLVQNGTKLAGINGEDIDLTSWSSNSPVCCEDVTLAGHSFGGCTMLSVLSSSSSGTYPAMPVSKVILYDPWLEPLPTPGPTPIASISEATFISGPTDASPHALESTKLRSRRPVEQMLVINSQVFTLWKDHFTRLKGVVDAWEPQGKRLLTLIESQHMHFSDIPVLPVIRTKSATKLMDLTTTLTLAFLHDTLDEALDQLPTKPMEEKIIGMRKDGRPKRTIVGSVGDVVVH
ncbi:platelet-activating factor acetylhydrolase, isoform II-domain-containing protein [Mycena sp. CBHHK59/15]|nr:platelet-activating factor acetylhydrolase, isoform II-domain-containing protein [Mycena sp. CBHHK59/15]